MAIDDEKKDSTVIITPEGSTDPVLDKYAEEDLGNLQGEDAYKAAEQVGKVAQGIEINVDNVKEEKKEESQIQEFKDETPKIEKTAESSQQSNQDKLVQMESVRQDEARVINIIDESIEKVAKQQIKREKNEEQELVEKLRNLQGIDKHKEKEEVPEPSPSLSSPPLILREGGEGLSSFSANDQPTEALAKVGVSAKKDEGEKTNTENPTAVEKTPKEENKDYLNLKQYFSAKKEKPYIKPTIAKKVENKKTPIVNNSVKKPTVVLSRKDVLAILKKSGRIKDVAVKKAVRTPEREQAMDKAIQQRANAYRDR